MNIVTYNITVIMHEYNGYLMCTNILLNTGAPKNNITFHMTPVVKSQEH